MRVQWIIVGIILTGGVGFGLAWVTSELAGNPTLPVSDANGSERMIAVGESQALSVISNTFRLFHYHDMMLSDAPGSDYLAPNWHPTNGFVLLPTVSIVGTVPTKGILGNRRLGYVATFHITTTPLATNKTKITVRTVTSKVLDGIALGHGGTVANTASVAPIRQEEENILKAIEVELDSEMRK